ncbi:hypothetical protein C5167_023077 [Papaver somniferum]|uniref:Uncharacterized protein n=1 Tax=Papaver somniferum TaxID=3469 RepID=A0A4Y7JNJ8_PAPSO|nr:hypothetical protein C5167_023077 [Papaver somniferum]
MKEALTRTKCLHMTKVVLHQHISMVITTIKTWYC